MRFEFKQSTDAYPIDIVYISNGDIAKFNFIKILYILFVVFSVVLYSSP